MVKRNIQATDIGKPQKLSASGYGFATGAQGTETIQIRAEGIPEGPGYREVPNSDSSKQIAALSELTHAVMAQARQDAFKQGQADQASDMLQIGNTVDSAAALIEQSSWLTRESYSQGVKFQQYSEGQLNVQQEIADQAAKSAEAGESIEVFSHKIKPSLARLNQQIVDLGLEGKAKDVAHDQLLSYVVSSQKTFQKQREFVAEKNYNTASNQTAAAGLSLLTQTTGAMESAQALSITANSILSIENGFDPLKAGDNAGKKTRAVLKGLLDNANGMSPEDSERIAGYAAYLRSDESINIPQEHRSAMLADIAESQKEFQEANSLTVANTLREYETMYNTTGGVDHAVLQQAAFGIHRQAQLGQLKLGDADSALNRLHRLGLKADKEMGKRKQLEGSTLDERRAFGISDKEQTTALASVATKQAYYEQNPERAGYYLAKEGIRLSNYHALTEGHKQLAGNYMSALTLGVDGKPSDIAERTFRLDKQLADDNTLNNDMVGASYQMKAWQSTLGKDGAAAMNILMQDPEVRSVQDAMQRYPQVLERVKDNRLSGNIGNVKIAEETLTSGWFGQVGGLSNTNGASFGNTPDPDILAAQTARINQLYLGNKEYLIGKYNIQTDDGGKSAMKAMYAEGLLTRTDFGTVIMSRAAKRVYGGGDEATPDAISRIDRGIRETVLTSMGPGANTALENMSVEYTPGGATVTVYTDNVLFSDTVQGTYSFTAQQIKEMDQATFNEQRAVKRPISDVPAFLKDGSISTSQVIEDTGEFLNNTLKSEALALISAEEGYFRAPSQPKNRDFHLVGHSVRLDIYEKMFGEEKTLAFARAAQDPSSKEYAALYNDFLVEHFKTFPEVVKTAGIDVGGAFGASKPAKVLASTFYHGPQSAWIMARAMRSVQEGGDIKQAVESVKQSDAYQQAGPSRKQMMLSAFEDL